MLKGLNRPHRDFDCGSGGVSMKISITSIFATEIEQ